MSTTTDVTSSGTTTAPTENHIVPGKSNVNDDTFSDCFEQNQELICGKCCIFHKVFNIKLLLPALAAGSLTVKWASHGKDYVSKYKTPFYRYYHDKKWFIASIASTRV